jgi:hypothetical protein
MLVLLLLFFSVASHAQPVSRVDVINMAREAKRDIRIYVKEGQLRFDPQKATLTEKKLFSDAAFWNRLETGIELNARCLDSSGQEQDSALGDKICLNTFRLAERLEKKDAYPEIASLLLYELLHAMEIGEPEAVRLRNNFQQSLYGKDENFLYEKLYYLHEEANEIVDALAGLEKAPSSKELIRLREVVANHQQESFYDRSEFAFAKLQATRLFLSSLFLDNKPLYDSAFAGQSSATLGEIKARLGLGAPDDLDSERLQKISGQAGLTQEFHELKGYFARNAAYLHQLAFNGALPKGLLPEVTSPWLDFAGHYAITDKQCTGAGDRSFAGVASLRIESQGQVRLQKEFYDGEIEESLQDWSFGNTGGLITVSGNESFAERQENLGTSWDLLWHRNRLTFFRTTEGIIMEEMSFSRFADSLYFYDCFFHLSEIPQAAIGLRFNRP